MFISSPCLLCLFIPPLSLFVSPSLLCLSYSLTHSLTGIIQEPRGAEPAACTQGRAWDVGSTRGPRQGPLRSCFFQCGHENTTLGQGMAPPPLTMTCRVLTVGGRCRGQGGPCHSFEHGVFRSPLHEWHHSPGWLHQGLHPRVP